MTKHQFGGHCKPPFLGKCRTNSFTSPSTSSGDHYYIFYCKKEYILYYPKSIPCVDLIQHGPLACCQDETASFTVSNSFNQSLVYTVHLTIIAKLNNVQPILENLWAMAKKKVARKKCETLYHLKRVARIGNPSRVG